MDDDRQRQRARRGESARRTPRAARRAARNRSGSRGRFRRPRTAPAAPSTRVAHSASACPAAPRTRAPDAGARRRRTGRASTAPRTRAGARALPVVVGREDAQRARQAPPPARGRRRASRSASKTSSARWQWESIMTSNDCIEPDECDRIARVARLSAPASLASTRCRAPRRHRLAAVGARGEDHAVRLDAHQLRRLQVGDDDDQAADERFRLVGFGDARDDRPLLGAGVDAQLASASSTSAPARRSAPWRRGARLT